MAQNRQISTSSFYGSRWNRIRIGTNGVERETRNVQIVVPELSSSEVEDNVEEDEIQSFKIASSERVEWDSDIEEMPMNADDADLIADGMDSMVESEANATMLEESTKPKDSSTKTKMNPIADPPRQWRRKLPAKVNNEFVGEPFPDPPKKEMSPLEYFKLFFDDKLISHIAHQSNLYATQKAGKSHSTNSNEIEQYLGILLMMGIIKLPQYRMYWGNATRFPMIASAMSVNRFDKVKRFFHCNDNDEMLPKGHPNHDKLHKVRPVIESVLRNCKNIPPEERHSVDEQIIPTKSRSGLKQYLPKKPHKWGIKIWARCGVSGIVYDFQVYTGAGSGARDDDNAQNLGVGGNVVKHLTSSLPCHVGYKVYFDNYFSSVNLLHYLKTQGIWAIGTIRADRLKGAGRLLQDKKSLEKKGGRGSSDWCVDANSNITIVRWLDNGVVQLISNHIGIADGTPARRWSMKEKMFIDIPRPLIVEEYNMHMGGVDLCDMLMALYRIELRSTKYYMHIVYYCISLSVVNGWLLYRRHCLQNGVCVKNQFTLLQFQTAVATSLLVAGKEAQSSRGRPSITPPPKKRSKSHATPTPSDDVRRDQIGHMPDFAEKKQRCRHCPNGYSFVQCLKCRVQLCFVKGKNCFKDFHSS